MPVYERECYKCELVKAVLKLEKIEEIFNQLGITFDGHCLWYTDDKTTVWTLKEVLNTFDELETEEDE